MPSLRKSELKPRVVRKTLADGTVKEYRYARRAVKRELPSPNTVGALVAAFKASPEWRAYSPKTQAVHITYLRPWEDDRLYRVPVASIGRKQIMTLRDAIATTRGNGAGTGFGRVASTMFGWAVDRGWIDHSPVHRIRALPGGTLPAWTEAQIAHAMASLPEPFRRVVVLALHTGQRRGDLCAMRWAQIAGSTVRLRQGKTGVELAIPIGAELAGEMAAWRRDTPGEHVLKQPQGLPWTDNHMSRAMAKALREIGLPARLNVHGLRKAAARRLAEAGCTIHQIAAITGHKTLDMVAHYTASADQEKLARAAVVRLVSANRKQNRASD
jgi:integrase